jgi:hypothetical protein
LWGKIRRVQKYHFPIKNERIKALLYRNLQAFSDAFLIEIKG